MTAFKKIILALLSIAIVVGAVSYFWPADNFVVDPENPPSIQFTTTGSRLQGNIGDQVCKIPGLHNLEENDDFDDDGDENDLFAGVHIYHSSKDLSIDDILDSIEPKDDNKVMIAYYDPENSEKKFSVYPKLSGQTEVTKSYEIPANEGFVIFSCKDTSIFGIKNAEQPSTVIPDSLDDVDDGWILLAGPSSKSLTAMLEPYKNKVRSVWIQTDDGFKFDNEDGSKVYSYLNYNLTGSNNFGDLKSDHYMAWVRIDDEIVLPTANNISKFNSPGKPVIKDKTSSTVKISWTAPSNKTSNQEVSYEVIANPGTSCTQDKSANSVSTPSAHSYESFEMVLAGLSPSKDYMIFVRAQNADGTWSNSDCESFKTADNGTAQLNKATILVATPVLKEFKPDTKKQKVDVTYTVTFETPLGEACRTIKVIWGDGTKDDLDYLCTDKTFTESHHHEYATSDKEKKYLIAVEPTDKGIGEYGDVKFVTIPPAPASLPDTITINSSSVKAFDTTSKKWPVEITYTYNVAQASNISLVIDWDGESQVPAKKVSADENGKPQKATHNYDPSGWDGESVKYVRLKLVKGNGAEDVLSMMEAIIIKPAPENANDKVTINSAKVKSFDYDQQKWPLDLTYTYNITKTAPGNEELSIDWGDGETTPPTSLNFSNNKLEQKVTHYYKPDSSTKTYTIRVTVLKKKGEDVVSNVKTVNISVAPAALKPGGDSQPSQPPAPATSELSCEGLYLCTKGFTCEEGYSCDVAGNNPLGCGPKGTSGFACTDTDNYVCKAGLECKKGYICKDSLPTHCSTNSKI
ncbi:MAG: fibronectin type III domain-containing protein [Patescibacteria group bacterium]